MVFQRIEILIVSASSPFSNIKTIGNRVKRNEIKGS